MRTRERVSRVRTRPHAAAVTSVGLATLTLQQFLASVGLDTAPVTAGGVLGAGAAVGGAAALGHRYSPRGQLRARYGRGGWLTQRQLAQCLGRSYVREDALTTRPSLEQLTRAQRSKLPDAEFGVCVGRTVTGPLVPQRVHFSYRDVALLIAPPQTGKTALLGNWVIDHPGAVLTTSTKIDAYQHTAAYRAKRGTVWVFNPGNLGAGEASSTFRWSPVNGCASPAIAEERASYLVAGTGEGDRASRIWDDSSAAVLRAYLMAAALDGRDMAQVSRWVANPDDEGALKLLKRYPHVAPIAWVQTLEQFQKHTAQNTKMSIYFTLRQAVAFMGDPEVARCCTPLGDDTGFDVAEFVNGQATLYLIGSDQKHGTIAPLLTALTGFIFEECKRLAAGKPNGRHDPPVLFALDEAALIVPVPLERWTADAGGRGVTLAIAVQAPAQLAWRWGANGASIIRSNANIKIYFGGLTEHSDLEAISAVCGQRPEDSITDNLDDGARTPRSVTRRLARTITPDRLRELPRWHVLVLYRTAKPVIVRIRPVWERPDIATVTRAL